MAVYNTGSDSANTSVRAFLTKIGEFYLGKGFNTASGHGKAKWQEIQNNTFNKRCAYCGISGVKFTIEHLIMFNRSQCGLHHPGNIVPCCQQCNKREKDEHGSYLSWQDHLLEKCNDIKEFTNRRQLILQHIKKEKYPNLTEDELTSLKAITSHLYSSTKSELDKALDLYKEIDKTLIKKRK